MGYARAEICRGREQFMTGSRVSVSVEAATISFRVGLLQIYYSYRINLNAEMTSNQKISGYA